MKKQLLVIGYSIIGIGVFAFLPASAQPSETIAVSAPTSIVTQSAPVLANIEQSSDESTTTEAPTTTTEAPTTTEVIIPPTTEETTTTVIETTTTTDPCPDACAPEVVNEPVLLDCPDDGTTFGHGTCHLPDYVKPAPESMHVEYGAPSKVCWYDSQAFECPANYEVPS